MLVTVDVYSLFVRSRQFQPTPPAFGAYNGRDPVGVLPISMASEGLSWGTVSMILRLAILVEHRLVTDRQTYDYGIYHASMASRGKNVRIQHRSLWKTVSVQFATPRSNWYLHLCGPKIGDTRSAVGLTAPTKAPRTWKVSVEDQCVCARLLRMSLSDPETPLPSCDSARTHFQSRFRVFTESSWNKNFKDNTAAGSLVISNTFSTISKLLTPNIYCWCRQKNCHGTLYVSQRTMVFEPSPFTHRKSIASRCSLLRPSTATLV